MHDKTLAYEGDDNLADLLRTAGVPASLAEVTALLERDPRLGFYEEHQRYHVTPENVRAKGHADAAILARRGQPGYPRP